jgi:hypothetical protein
MNISFKFSSCYSYVNTITTCIFDATAVVLVDNLFSGFSFILHNFSIRSFLNLYFQKCFCGSDILVRYIELNHPLSFACLLFLLLL